VDASPAADEANALIEWKEEDKGEVQLNQLIRFFVKVTKEDNRAHVVLATSDFFLLEWLRGSAWLLPVHAVFVAASYVVWGRCFLP
jgi:hypothetical protein